MKKLLILLLSAILSLSIVFGTCSSTVACQNQNGAFSCSPSDSSCTYHTFVQDGQHCVVDTSFTDNDQDNDGWSNGCDAFIHEASEWIDIDGDGVGHTLDCNDYDTSIGNCNAQPEETTSESSTPQRSGGSKGCVAKWDCSAWGSCIDGKQTRTCERANYCFWPQSPETEQSCVVIESPTAIVVDTGLNESDINETSEQVEEAKNNHKSGLSTISGQVVKEQESKPHVGTGILIVLILVGLGMIVYRLYTK